MKMLRDRQRNVEQPGDENEFGHAMAMTNPDHNRGAFVPRLAFAYSRPRWLARRSARPSLSRSWLSSLLAPTPAGLDFSRTHRVPDGSCCNLGVWGFRQCLRMFAITSATARNRSCEGRMAAPMVTSAKGITLKKNLGFPGVALRDIPTCFKTCIKLLCVAGTILLPRFQKKCCIFHGRSSTLKTSDDLRCHFCVAGAAVSCCLIFGNCIVSAV